MDLEKLHIAVNKVLENAIEFSGNSEDTIGVLITSLILFLAEVSVNEEVYEHNLEQAIDSMKEFPMELLMKSRNLHK